MVGVVLEYGYDLHVTIKYHDNIDGSAYSFLIHRVCEVCHASAFEFCSRKVGIVFDKVYPNTLSNTELNVKLREDTSVQYPPKQ